MGIWNTAFCDLKAAKRLEKLLKAGKGISPLKHEKDLYSIVGCDNFHDKYLTRPQNIDLTKQVLKQLDDWIKDIDCFRGINPDALVLCKKLIKQYKK